MQEVWFMTVYGSRPKPRLLLINCSDEELARYNLNKVFPTIRNIEQTALESVRQAEFDVVIALEPLGTLPFDKHLHVVYIGGDSIPDLLVSREHAIWTDLHTSYATEFVVEDTLDDEMHQLVKNTLLPLAKSRTSNPMLISMADNQVVNLWAPLIADGDENPLAGRLERRQAESKEFWYLPSGLPEAALAPWMKLLLRRWALINPETFSAVGNWREHPDWQSAEEAKARAAIDAARRAFRKLAKRHAAELGSLTHTYEAAQIAASTSQRALLTQQGAALKHEVATTFKLLGFAVEDMDGSGEKGDMLEDLKVTDQLKDGASWTTLVEVRGYQRGAQLKDLLRIGRFIKRHIKKYGQAPNAAWYVVNQFIDKAPNERGLALEGNTAEVAVFAEDDNGLVIDTTLLFQLRKKVEAGELSKEDARQRLRTTTGCFRQNNMRQ